MLDFETKLNIFSSILEQEEESYADSFNGLIFMHSEGSDFNFLHNFNSEKEIKNWIEKLKGRIVMHENDAPIEDIIDDYMLCG